MLTKLFGKKNQKSAAEMYADHLYGIFQVEPEFYLEKSQHDGVPGVSCIVFRDIPEKGMITGITYGLSLVTHPDWKFGRPELMITARSTDITWARVVAYLANGLRGDCPFSYSNTINFKQNIADDSEMDAFLVFAPSIITDKEGYLNIDIGLDYKINIAGVYPIYASEMELVTRWGLKNFWHHPDFDMYNVNRKPITVPLQ
jgi:hypothetical protein